MAPQAETTSNNYAEEGLAIDDSGNNGREPNGRYVSVFHPDDTNNAVLFPLDHRSVPAIIHQLTRMPFLAVRAATHPQGILIQGLDPGMHEGFMAESGLSAHMPGMLVPLRILIHQQIEQEDRILHLIKLEHPLLGGDLRILVDTCGSLDTGRVKDACRDQLQQDVVAKAVHARCPDSNTYRNMIEIRVLQRSGLPTLNSLVAAGFIRIGRARYRVLPFTHSKAIYLQPPKGPSGEAEINFITAAEDERRHLLTYGARYNVIVQVLHLEQDNIEVKGIGSNIAGYTLRPDLGTTPPRPGMNRACVFLFPNVRAKAHFWAAPPGDDDILEFGVERPTVMNSEDACRCADPCIC